MLMPKVNPVLQYHWGKDLCSRPLLSKSCSKSSWEAELIALSDGLSPILRLKQFLECQGHNIPVTVHQNNMSTIFSATEGDALSNWSRHVNIRYFWSKQLNDNGDIQLIYVSTDLMTADLLTKPLKKDLFNRLRYLFLNDA